MDASELERRTRPLVAPRSRFGLLVSPSSDAVIRALVALTIVRMARA
jgi:hypothetical protein